MRAMLLYAESGVVKATVVPEIPKAILFHNGVCHQANDLIANFDYLRDPEGLLIGFDLLTVGFLEPDSPFFQSRFIRSASVRTDPDRNVQIFMRQVAQFSLERVEGTFAGLYFDRQNEPILSIPEWKPWGRIGFPLEMQDGPQIPSPVDCHG